MSDEIQENILNEIRARHERDERWLRDISALGPQSHEDRAFLLTEIERLRARVEKMRAGTITLEVMLKLFAKREELLAVVRAMREEAKP
jgi:hypothetical protein